MKNIPWTGCWQKTRALLPAQCSKCLTACQGQKLQISSIHVNSELWTHMIWSQRCCSFCHSLRCDGGGGDTDHYLIAVGFSSYYDLTHQCLKKQGKSINNLRTQDKYNLNNTVRINRSGTMTYSINTLRKREPPNAEWKLRVIIHSVEKTVSNFKQQEQQQQLISFLSLIHLRMKMISFICI